jgi:hypothetical protein
VNKQIKCGHCHGYHDSVADVRGCAQRPVAAAAPVMVADPPITEPQQVYLTDLIGQKVWPSDIPEVTPEVVPHLTKAVASTLIKMLIDAPKKPQGMGVPDTIPDGRYAYLSDEYGKIVFYRVVTARDGVTRKVQKVLGSPGDFRYTTTTKTEADKFIQAIVGDPAFASQLFGHAVGACGVCGSPLTDPESIRLGIGPVCAKKHDW